MVYMQGALLVFSLRKQTSFVSLSYWLEEIKNVRHDTRRGVRNRQTLVPTLPPLHCIPVSFCYCILDPLLLYTTLAITCAVIQVFRMQVPLGLMCTSLLP